MDGNTKFLEACGRLYEPFFDRFPNDDLQMRVGITLRRLLDRKAEFPGEAGGWAGGIVYAVSSIGVGIPDVPNADAEKAFGVPMNTIRKRAKEVREILGDDLPMKAEWMKQATEFTLRDEANAICAYAFRNGPLERIHHEYNISQADMKELMINACEHMAKIMAKKQQSPEEYDRFIRDYHRKFCGDWER